MYGIGKSDRLIVPRKPPNKAAGAPAAAEGVEGRGLAVGNSRQPPQTRTQSRRALMLKLARIRQVAKQRKGERFTRKVNWVLDADIRGFQAIDHAWMQQFLQHRIAVPRSPTLIPAKRLRVNTRGRSPVR